MWRGSSPRAWGWGGRVSLKVGLPLPHPRQRGWGPGLHGGVAALREDPQREVRLIARTGGAGHHQVVAGEQAAATAHVAAGAEGRAVGAQQAPQERATMRRVPEAQQLRGGDGVTLTAQVHHAQPPSSASTAAVQHARADRPPITQVRPWPSLQVVRGLGASLEIESGVGPHRRLTSSGICKK